ncbi:hypothetical protein [Dactylosporangium sp. NBC_01737]|uniref:hypothetical protein n=1 Tax=Dactylosporangium sp. NBC_01737 TaxID=2975959 RepID=UPI002E0FAC60
MEAGVRAIGPHQVRHLLATHLLDSGVRHPQDGGAARSRSWNVDTLLRPGQPGAPPAGR